MYNTALFILNVLFSSDERSEEIPNISIISYLLNVNDHGTDPRASYGIMYTRSTISLFINIHIAELDQKRVIHMKVSYCIVIGLI